MRPGRLVLRAGGACDFDPGHLLEVYAAHRERFIAILAGFGPADWAAPTRCAEWSAHEVVRHLCDTNDLGIAAAPGGGELSSLALSVFDPRVTPRLWLAASAGEAPDATLARFTASSLDLLGVARERLAGDGFEVALPFGPMDWTALMLHGFWDSWLHERDVLLARGGEEHEDDDGVAYAAAYGVFIAAAVAGMFGSRVRDTLTLGGPGGGVYTADAGDGGEVTVTVSRGAADGPPAARVADALAGRGQPLGSLLPDLSAGSREALSGLAGYFAAPM